MFKPKTLKIESNGMYPGAQKQPNTSGMKPFNDPPPPIVSNWNKKSLQHIQPPAAVKPTSNHKQIFSQGQQIAPLGHAPLAKGIQGDRSASSGLTGQAPPHQNIYQTSGVSPTAGTRKVSSSGVINNEQANSTQASTSFPAAPNSRYPAGAQDPASSPSRQQRQNSKGLNDRGGTGIST